MKRYTWALLLVFISLGLGAQDEPQTPATKNDSIPLDLAKKIFIYNASKAYNDPMITRMALYQLMAENPTNIALRDTLALHYYTYQSYASAALVAQDIAKADKTDMLATEIAASSFDRLGVKDRALGYYETLYLNNTDNINALYKISFLQYELKRYEEAANSIEQLKQHKLASETKIVFPTEDQQGQQVSMNIAARRLTGMIAEAKGDKAGALKIYNEILKESPNFEIVKKQIDLLNKK